MKYEHLDDIQKEKFIKQMYEVEKKSFADIAKIVGTYPNKVRRDAIKFNINIRDKSKAQQNALMSGKTQHPTQGKKRSQTVKEKIGLSVLQSWENLDETEINKRKIKARNNWNNKDDNEKENILKQANAAVRLTSKTGSKLEKFLLDKLLAAGYVIEFHKEHSILNTKLQIDLFIPKLNVAIEVDGPSHFEPVWGDDALKRNKKYDNTKTGLIIGKGLFLIRIKQSRDFSKTRAMLIFDQLQQILSDIENKKITNNKVLKIGD